MNIVDGIVSVIVVGPLLYGAFWYYSRGRFKSEVADQIVRDLSERSRMAANKTKLS